MAAAAGSERGPDGTTLAKRAVVLLVDDEPEWITWMSCYLRDCGWLIVPAASGEDGLAAYDRSLPDVVIVDQKMPGMSGTEMADALRDRGFSGPMLLLSATIDADTDAECSRLAMHALSKLAHGAIFHTLDLFRQSVLAERVTSVTDGGDDSMPAVGRHRLRKVLSVSREPMVGPRAS
jgi:CheY-like chemotaxis protein